MKKKLFFLALLLIVAGGVWAETIKVTIGGLNYELFPNTEYATVLATEGVSGAIVIPSTVTHDGTEYAVTQIAENAFQQNTAITSVTIGDNMDYINDAAFYMCSNLESVTLGKKTRVIGHSAFRFTKIKEIVLPNSVKYIQTWAFHGCSQLEMVTIGNSVISITYDAFEGCSAVTDVYCYANPATLSWSAVEGTQCFADNKATKCHVVNADEWSSFSGLNLTFYSDLAALVENNIYYFLDGSTAYVGKCFNATGDITIRNVVTVGGTDYPVTNIIEDAFWNNSNITSVTLGNNVTTIGGTAFSYCTALETMTLPASLTYIGENAFYKCEAVTDVYCSIADPTTLTWVSNSTDFIYSTKFRVSAADPWETAFPNAKVSFVEPTPTITLYDNLDNSQTINDNYGETRNVILSGHKFYKDGKWNTLCLPFTVGIAGSIFEGADIMMLTSSSLSGGVLTLTFSDMTDQNSQYYSPTIPAGYPLIVRWANTGETLEDQTFNEVRVGGMGMMMGGSTGPIEWPRGDVILDEVTGDPVWDPNTGMPMFTTPDCTMLGCYGPETLTAGKTRLFLGGDDKLYYPETDQTMSAFHAYFKLNNGIEAGTPAGVRQFVLNFGEESTGVTTPLANRRGEGGEAWYTLDGRRLNGKPTQRGMYINNGKAVVIK